MRRYHPIIAIILGYIISAILVEFVPNTPFLPNSYLSSILAIFVLILGGFIATYLSHTNKSIMGFYEGLIFSIGILPSIFIFKPEITFFTIINLVLPPFMGILGGYIGKSLRLHLDNENN
jgi:putative membrane protein (TIGR04086 family)